MNARLIVILRAHARRASAAAPSSRSAARVRSRASAAAIAPRGAATDRDRRATPTLLTPRRVATHRTTRHGINRHATRSTRAFEHARERHREPSRLFNESDASRRVDRRRRARSSPHTAARRRAARAPSRGDGAKTRSGIAATMATLARDDARALATRGNILRGDECEGTPSGWDVPRGLWAREPARARDEGRAERRDERRARGAGADGGAGDDDVRVRGGVVGFAIERALARERAGGRRRRARRIASAGAGRDARAGRTR